MLIERFCLPLAKRVEHNMYEWPHTSRLINPIPIIYYIYFIFYIIYFLYLQSAEVYKKEL